MSIIIDIIADFIVDLFLFWRPKRKSKTAKKGETKTASVTTKVEAKDLKNLSVNLKYADIRIRFGSTTEVQACGHDRYQKGVQVVTEGEKLIVSLSEEVIEDLGLNTDCGNSRGLLTTKRIKNVALPLCRVVITVPKGTNVELIGKPHTFDIEDSTGTTTLNLDD